jgi:hypothetical protein
MRPKFGLKAGPTSDAARRAFDLRTLPDDLRDFYAQFLGYGRATPSTVSEKYHRAAAEGRVRVLYADRRQFNLSAESPGDTHTIELNIAFPCLLHFVFNNVLRLPYVFPQVGDSAAETPYREPGDGRLVPFELPERLPVVEALRVLPGVSRPKDDDRALFASTLTELASTFCVFHEVGHVIGGHSGYEASRMWGKPVSEFTGDRWHFCHRRALRQVMEREADIIATVMTMSFVLNDPATRRHFRECLAITGNDDLYPYQILPILLFSLKVLFGYLAQIPAGLKVHADHPHPLLRALYVHNAIRLTAVDDLGLDGERLDAGLDEITEQEARLWNDLGMRIPALEGPEDGQTLARIAEREITRLEEAHRRLQPRYAAWSYIPDSVWKEHEYDPG